MPWGLNYWNGRECFSSMWKIWSSRRWLMPKKKWRNCQVFLPLERVLSVLKVDLFVLLPITPDKADLLTKLLFCFFFLLLFFLFFCYFHLQEHFQFIKFEWFILFPFVDVNSRLVKQISFLQDEDKKMQFDLQER